MKYGQIVAFFFFFFLNVEFHNGQLRGDYYGTVPPGLQNICYHLSRMSYNKWRRKEKRIQWSWRRRDALPNLQPKCNADLHTRNHPSVTQNATTSTQAHLVRPVLQRSCNNYVWCPLLETCCSTGQETVDVYPAVILYYCVLCLNVCVKKDVLLLLLLLFF